MDEISQRENYNGKFGDKRLDKRAALISSLLYFNQSSSVHGITPREAEQKAAYRFFANEKVEESKLIDTLKERSSYLCTDKDILVIQDTTEINLDNHRNRLQRGTGIGLTGNNNDLGFFLHGSLVLDAATETVLGFSDIQLWHRAEDKLNKYERDFVQLPIEEKESYKWIKACNEGKEHLSKANNVTFIEDREGDMYEQFCLVPDNRTHLIIRGRINRNLSGGGKLHDVLSQQPVVGSYNIDLVHDIRKGIEKRTATVEVRFCKVTVKKPKDVKRSDIPKEIDIHVVEVKENNPMVKEPIVWHLLTTHAVSNYEEAKEIVNKYRLRWYIEQLFRLLKKKGFGIESSELESGWAIRKLTIMILNAALRVMQMLLAHGNKESQPIEQVFDKQEIKCLQMLNEKLEGDTDKAKNNNDPQRLSWATWIIAKLGGWKGYNRKRPPGPILFKKGLDKFMSIFEGWQLALEIQKDVS